MRIAVYCGSFNSLSHFHFSSQWLPNLYFSLPPFGAFAELVINAPNARVLADDTGTIVYAKCRVSDFFGIPAYHIEVGIPVCGSLHQKRACLVR